MLIDGALGELDPSASGRVPLLRSALIAEPLVAMTLTNPHAIGALSRSMLAHKEAAARWRETLRAPMRRPGSTAAYAAWLPSLLETNDGAPSRRTAALLKMRPPVRLIWGEADTVAPVTQGLASLPTSKPPNIKRAAERTRRKEFKKLEVHAELPPS